MSKRKMHSVPHSLGEVSVASPARGGRRSAGSGERVGGWAGGREGRRRRTRDTREHHRG